MCVTFQVALRQIQELKPPGAKKEIHSSLLQKCDEFSLQEVHGREKKTFSVILRSNVLQPLIDMFMPNSKKETLVLYGNTYVSSSGK